MYFVILLDSRYPQLFDLYNRQDNTGDEFRLLDMLDNPAYLFKDIVEADFSVRNFLFITDEYDKYKIYNVKEYLSQFKKAA